MVSFKAVPGFFVQGHSDTNDDEFDFTSPSARFGLEPSIRDWGDFQESVKDLQQKHGKDNVKVIFLARHGQGVHNYVMKMYGREWWEQDGMNHKYSNGEHTWGPDPELTKLGVDQAMEANAAWNEQLSLEKPVPLPQSFYVSPFSRACDTLLYTWTGILPGVQMIHHKDRTAERLGNIAIMDGTTVPVLIHSLLRETIGFNTCDKLRPIEYTLERYPDFGLVPFYPPPPPGEDDLWNVEVRETNEAMRTRLKQFLVNIFENDPNTYISVTCHAGVIRNLLAVLGHRRFFLKTGGMIPVVVVREN